MSLVDVVHLSRKNCSHPIHVKLKYATEQNFVGRPLKGYHATDVALLTEKAGMKLCEVQNALIEHHGVGLIIYDSYRPKRAVEDIYQWSLRPVANAYELERKAKHYPNIEKHQLFELGYVSKDSGHCYGNTLDVFLIDIKNNQGVEMGCCYDYMDKKSHLDITAEEIGAVAHKNRGILIENMEKHGFESYSKEFWHFSHQGDRGREVEAPLDVEIISSFKRSE